MPAYPVRLRALECSGSGDPKPQGIFFFFFKVEELYKASCRRIGASTTDFVFTLANLSNYLAKVMNTCNRSSGTNSSKTSKAKAEETFVGCFVSIH